MPTTVMATHSVPTITEPTYVRVIPDTLETERTVLTLMNVLQTMEGVTLKLPVPTRKGH